MDEARRMLDDADRPLPEPPPRPMAEDAREAPDFTDLRLFWSWLRCWVQLGILAVLAIGGAFFASQGRQPGDYQSGLMLAAAAFILAVMLVKRRLDGAPDDLPSLVLVDDMRGLAFVIPLFTIAALAGLFIAKPSRRIRAMSSGSACSAPAFSPSCCRSSTSSTASTAAGADAPPPIILRSAAGGERLIIACRETGGGARLMVEGRLQPARETAAHQIVKCLDRGEAAGAAERFEPAPADRDMADLVTMQARKERRARRIAGAREAVRHVRRHVEAARFEDERHDGEARQRIVGGRRGRFPQPVMRRKVAVAGAQFPEPPRQQREMFGFLGSDGGPIGEKGARRHPIGETRDEVPGEIDGVQLDMRQRVQQRDASSQRAEGAALRHFARRTQRRARRPAGAVGRPAQADRQAAG